MSTLSRIGALFFLVYFVGANLSYVLLLIMSVVARSKHHFRLATTHWPQLKRSPFLVPVSIIVPAHNEQSNIVEGVRALLDLDYPELSVVVVNDGSEDNTLGELKQVYELHEARLLYVSSIPTAPVRALYLSQTEPRLMVVDKENAGHKADAVNAGINAATGAFVCVIDADSILEKDALLRIMAAVHTETTDVVAAGGIVRVANGCKIRNGQVEEIKLPSSHFELVQIIEYLRSFLISRQGWARLDMLTIISGAFGVFRTRIIREIGGLKNDTVGEDLDLTIRLHRHLCDSKESYRIAFVPDPACWTEVPSDLKSLNRQRARWQHGLFDVLWRNRDMLFRWRYGRIGFIALPYLWIFELAEPVIELFGYISIASGLLLGTIDHRLLFNLLVFGYGFAATLSMAAVVLEEVTYRRYPSGEDIVRLLLYCFLEQILYRQIHMWSRLRGIWQQLAGGHGWAAIKRTGFHPTVTEKPAQAVPQDSGLLKK